MQRLALSFVSICELLFGLCFCLYTAMAIAGRHGTRSLLGAIICAAIAGILLGTSFALMRPFRWAYWSSWLIGLAVFSFGVVCIWDSVKVKEHYSGEEGFGFAIGAILLLMSLTGMIILSLPIARSFIFRKEARPVP
jgi:uncharacterized membrane protein HdeD (DUF308 family)